MVDLLESHDNYSLKRYELETGQSVIIDYATHNPTETEEGKSDLKALLEAGAKYQNLDLSGFPIARQVIRWHEVSCFAKAL